MYIHLYRNAPQGSAITGRLVIDGRWFCNTLERVGYQIPALCYHVAVTHSPKFKRLLPIVQNVPERSGIRFHRGTKPEHSTGCILVVADNNPSPLHPTQAGAPTKFVTLWGALTPYTKKIALQGDFSCTFANFSLPLHPKSVVYIIKFVPKSVESTIIFVPKSVI
jgi:hypothetical protein